MRKRWDRQTDRQTDWHTDRQTNKQTDKRNKKTIAPDWVGDYNKKTIAPDWVGDYNNCIDLMESTISSDIIGTCPFTLTPCTWHVVLNKEAKSYTLSTTGFNPNLQVCSEWLLELWCNYTFVTVILHLLKLSHTPLTSVLISYNSPVAVVDTPQNLFICKWLHWIYLTK